MEALATFGWREDSSVEEGLFQEPHRFDFFQAVKILEMLDPGRHGVGTGVEPSREAVRFRSRVALDFPPSDIERLDEPRNPGEPPTLTVNFLGLASVQGPLPRSFVEEIQRRIAEHDTAPRDFLDIFNHRLVSILFEIRRRHRTAMEWRAPDEARAARAAFGFFGLGTESVRRRLAFPDRSLLPAAGLLSRVARTMVGTERVVEGHFGVRAEVEPYQGRWYRLEEDQLTAIGASGRNRTLGRDAVLARRVWDQEAGFELRLGPMGFDTFLDFLPIGEAWEPLRSLVGFYSGHELFFRARLILEAEEVPELRLGRGDGPRLGWTTWLKTRPTPEDDRQVAILALFGEEGAT